MNAAGNFSRQRRGRRSGFTLLELLLSISLTALVGAMAYAGLSAAISADERNQENAERLREVNLAMMILARDLRQSQRRKVRNEQGVPITGFFGNGTDDRAMALTRGGWQNPAGRNRSNMQRVHYHFRDNKLIRESWTILDRTADSASFSNTLLSDVNSLQIKFLRPLAEQNETLGSEWLDRWMPDMSEVHRTENVHPDVQTTFLPIAVDVEMELEDLGRVRRLFAVAAEWPRYNNYLSRWYQKIDLDGAEP